MRYRKFFLISFLYFILSITIPAQESASSITNILNEWIDAFNKKDLQKSLAIYSEDFIGYYPDQPDQSFKTIKEQYQHLLTNKNLSIALAIKIDEIQMSGNLTFVRMILSATVKPAFATEANVAHDKGIQVWQKNQDGEWKLIRASTFPVQIKN